MSSDRSRIGPSSDAGLHSRVAEVVRKHQDALYCLAYRILGRSVDAEEARQAVLLKLVERPDVLSEVRSVDAWLKRCVINEAMMLLRGRRRRPEVRLPDFECIATDSQCVAEAMRAEQRNMLDVAMQQLDPELRAMLSLRFDDEMTIREIGEVMGQPHTTVQSKLERAIKQLRTLFAQQE